LHVRFCCAFSQSLAWLWPLTMHTSAEALCGTFSDSKSRLNAEKTCCQIGRVNAPLQNRMKSVYLTSSSARMSSSSIFSVSENVRSRFLCVDSSSVADADAVVVVVVVSTSASVELSFLRRRYKTFFFFFVADGRTK
jgi:hypothetical protein